MNIPFLSLLGLLCLVACTPSVQQNTNQTPTTTAQVTGAFCSSANISVACEDNTTHNAQGDFIRNIPPKDTSLGQSAQINWSGDGIIRAKGAGAARAGLTLAEAQVHAREAAQADAMRLLAVTINGVGITAETTVRDFLLESDEVRVQFDAFIRGARFPNDGIEIEQLADGSFIVFATAEVSIYDQEGVSGVILANFQSQQTSISQYRPFFFSQDSLFAQTRTSYTGIILDASAFQVKPLLAFEVHDASGYSVYTLADVNNAALAARGMLNYYGDVAQARDNVARVGANPLVIEVLAVENGKLIIADTDAANLRQMSELFSRAAVSLVADDGS